MKYDIYEYIHHKFNLFSYFSYQQSQNGKSTLITHSNQLSHLFKTYQINPISFTTCYGIWIRFWTERPKPKLTNWPGSSFLTNVIPSTHPFIRTTSTSISILFTIVIHYHNNHTISYNYHLFKQISLFPWKTNETPTSKQKYQKPSNSFVRFHDAFVYPIESSSMKNRWIEIVSFMDAMGVALVITLVPFFTKELGIGAMGFGIITSLYGFCQIIGGAVISYLLDRYLSRKTVLLISSIGSGMSYALLLIRGSLPTLIISRMLVGFIKQTTTSCKVGLDSLLSILLIPRHL